MKEIGDIKTKRSFRTLKQTVLLVTVAVFLIVSYVFSSISDVCRPDLVINRSFLDRFLNKCGYFKLDNAVKAADRYQYSKNLGFDVGFYSNIQKDNYRDFLKPIDLSNASAIFNSINSVLDGPLGTIQPNGVSVFTGYIPEGTFFYHGRSAEEGLPESPEWVAMHWEYSYHFGSHSSGVRRPGEIDEPGRRPPENFSKYQFKGNKFPFDSSKPAELLTFQNVKPLNKIIVMEGASAKKADDGTMDVHNVLAHQNFSKFNWWQEVEMVKLICDWGDEKFGGLDGIVRMEVGFEIVFCNFESDKLKLVSADTFMDDLNVLDFPTPLPVNESLGNKNPSGNVSHEDQVLDDIRFQLLRYMPNLRSWESYARHYEKEPRIKIDYRGFTTALNKTYISPDTYLRRLKDTPYKVRQEFADGLEDIFTKNQDNINYWDGNDWQTYTRHVISKFYSHFFALNKTYELYYANTSDISGLALNTSLTTYHYYRRYQSPKIKDALRREAEAVKHAVYEYTSPKKLLQSESDVLIWSALAKVVEAITKELFEQFKFSKQLLNYKYNNANYSDEQVNQEIDSHFKSLNQLFKDLDWTILYGCKEKCPPDSICYIPTWGPSPLWNLSRSNFGREFRDGALRIKQDCQCIDINTAFKYPHFPF